MECTTGFARADAIATLVVVVLMLRAGSGLIRDSGRIFLEAAPPDLDPAALGTEMAAMPTGPTRPSGTAADRSAGSGFDIV